MPVSPEVVVSEESAVSAMDPAVGVVRTGASLTAVMDVPRLSVLAEMAVVPPLLETFIESPELKISTVYAPLKDNDPLVVEKVPVPSLMPSSTSVVLFHVAVETTGSV